jgi:hypothetical protein
VRSLIPYCFLFIGAALCLGSNAQPVNDRPLNARRALHANELQGGDIHVGRHGSRRMTVLSNVSVVSAPEGSSESPDLVSRIGRHAVMRQSGAKPNVSSLYVGAAFQHDTQEIGLITKEISVRFTGVGVPNVYQTWNLKEVVAKSGIYILTVTDLAEWKRAIRQLQGDSQVSLAQPRIVTSERQAK